MKSKVIMQGALTSDCWPIQVWGPEACKGCEFRGTKNCGGKSIIKKIKNGKFSKSGLPDVSMEIK